VPLSRPASLWAIASLAAVLGVSGCGRAGDEAAARAVANQFFTAVASGDGERACAQLSPDTRSKLESDEGKPCRQAIGDVGLKASRVTSVHVHIVDAMVELADGEAAFLGHGTDGWRLTAVGCHSMGKTADRPYDCDVED
jgi:hypothetical protein